MKHRGRQTKRGTSDVPPTARRARPQDTAPAPGVAKPAEQHDSSRGAIEHHQGNHGRRER